VARVVFSSIPVDYARATDRHKDQHKGLPASAVREVRSSDFSLMWYEIATIMHQIHTASLFYSVAFFVYIFSPDLNT
jgi:hypothetical protein